MYTQMYVYVFQTIYKLYFSESKKLSLPGAHLIQKNMGALQQNPFKITPNTYQGLLATCQSL